MIKSCAIILGRGIEGCGNTKRAIMLNKYNKKNNIESKIFVNDLKWPRRNSFKFEYEEFNVYIESSLKNINYKLNQYDCIVYLSLPPTNEYIKYELDMYKKYIIENINYDIKKIFIQTDHNILSIKRNELLFETCDISNVIFCHSINNPFANLIKTNDILKPFKNFNKIKQLKPTIDFDEHKSLYWKDVKDINLKHIKFISRSAKWKGHHIFYKLFDELKKDNYNDFLFTAEGMEMSLAGLPLYFINGKRENGFLENINQYHTSLRFSKYEENYINKNKINIFGPYIHNECMERLSKCGFGFELYNLNENWYGESIESAMLEIICNGCIPIFHKHFGINTKYYNETLNEFENFEITGTLFLDNNNIKIISEIIKNISENKLIFEKYRNISFNYWKKFADINIVFKYMYDMLL